MDCPTLPPAPASLQDKMLAAGRFFSSGGVPSFVAEGKQKPRAGGTCPCRAAPACPPVQNGNFVPEAGERWSGRPGDRSRSVRCRQGSCARTQSAAEAAKGVGAGARIDSVASAGSFTLPLRSRAARSSQSVSRLPLPLGFVVVTYLTTPLAEPNRNQATPRCGVCLMTPNGQAQSQLSVAGTGAQQR